MNQTIQAFRPGVLSREQIETLIQEKYVHASGRPGLSSMDLHLGPICWKMKGGIKGAAGSPYSTVLKDDLFVEKRIVIEPDSGLILEPKSTHVFELQETVQFEEGSGIFAYATGKSRIGRLDVLTRLIVDHCDTYDKVPDGSSGSLYLEVTPITFPIKVGVGLALNQIRFFRGKTALSGISEDEYALYEKMLLNGATQSRAHTEEDHHLHLDLTPIDAAGKLVSAFKAKNSGSAIDLNSKEKLPPKQYWDRIPSDSQTLRIEPEGFYILRSIERFKLPSDVAVYAHAMEENLGEIRIHYAGFVHPNFGSSREDGRGTPLIFEVRGHNVETFLRHGEVLARISFYKMSQPCKLTAEDREEEQKSDFENQELRLSTYFAPWE